MQSCVSWICWNSTAPATLTNTPNGSGTNPATAVNTDEHKNNPIFIVASRVWHPNSMIVVRLCFELSRYGIEANPDLPPDKCHCYAQIWSEM